MYILLNEDGQIIGSVNEQPKEDVLFTEVDYADFANPFIKNEIELNLRWDFENKEWINLTK